MRQIVRLQFDKKSREILLALKLVSVRGLFKNRTREWHKTHRLKSHKITYTYLGHWCTSILNRWYLIYTVVVFYFKTICKLFCDPSSGTCLVSCVACRLSKFPSHRSHLFSNLNSRATNQKRDNKNSNTGCETNKRSTSSALDGICKITVGGVQIRAL